MIFETHTVYAGDTGSLSSSARAGASSPACWTQSISSSTTTAGSRSCCRPERPAGHTGNFIATATDGANAGYVIARMLFHDWEHEVCPDLHIAQIGAEERIQPR